MGDEKNTEKLEEISGGPDTVAPIITDALEDVDGGARLDGLILNEVEGGAGSPSGSDDESLEDVNGLID